MIYIRSKINLSWGRCMLRWFNLRDVIGYLFRTNPKHPRWRFIVTTWGWWAWCLQRASLALPSHDAQRLGFWFAASLLHINTLSDLVTKLWLKFVGFFVKLCCVSILHWFYIDFTLVLVSINFHWFYIDFDTKTK